MFLEPDEHIIIDEDWKDHPFNDDDIKKIIDAGMKTVYVTCSVCWDKIYSLDSDKLDWSSLDARIDKFLKYDLKLMIPFYYTMPRWFPDNWYIENKLERIDLVIPNYANEHLILTIEEFADDILNHYFDIRNRIHLIYAIPSGGEFLWDTCLTKDFPVSDESIFNFVISIQKFLIRQHGEIWLNFHTFLGDPNNWNNIHLPFLYQALVDEFPNVPIYSIQAAHFSVGYEDYFTDINNQMKVKEYNEKFGIKFFIGSDYCEGLKTNFDKAIEQKVYGFFTAPIGQENPNRHTSIEPWMMDNLRETNKRFKEIYNG